MRGEIEGLPGEGREHGEGEEKVGDGEADIVGSWRGIDDESEEVEGAGMPEKGEGIDIWGRMGANLGSGLSNCSWKMEIEFHFIQFVTNIDKCGREWLYW